MSKTQIIEYQGPYGGLHTQMPENLIDPKFSPGFNNFNIRNAELRSRPVFRPAIPGPDGSNPILGFGTFIDQTNTPHTWAVTSRGMWQLNGINTKPPYWNFIGNVPVNSGTPVSSQIFLNNIYGTNGAPGVFYWDGINNSAQTLNTTVVQQQSQAAGGITGASVDAGGTGYAVGDTGSVTGGGGNAAYTVLTVALGVVQTISISEEGSGYALGTGAATATGGTQPGSGTGLTVNITSISVAVPEISGSIGGLFMYELNDSIQIANTVEVVPLSANSASAATQIQNFPYRVRWSANGIPNVWDPTVNTTAGYDDLLEVPDSITGVLAIGSQVAYIFRTNGITEQTVTGSAVNPFNFNHLWASKRGIGNVFINSVAAYGSVGFFISSVNIYQVSIYSFEEIGGGARDSIIADLYSATGTVAATVVDQYIGGYVYLTYKLCIPLGSFMRVYSYSLEDKSWEPEDFSSVNPTCAPAFVWR